MKHFTFCLLLVCSLANSILAQTKPSASALNGKWIFVSASEMELGKIADNQLPDLSFTDSARTVSGFTGCNKISGSFEVEGERFMFGPMVSTYKACPDMKVEQYLTRFLTHVGFYKVENDRLYLYDKDDRSRYIIYRRNNLI